MAQPISGNMYLLIGAFITGFSIYLNTQRRFGVFIIVGAVMFLIGLVKKAGERNTSRREAAKHIHHRARTPAHRPAGSQHNQPMPHAHNAGQYPRHGSQAKQGNAINPRFCPNCGVSLGGRDRFCSQCGVRIV